MNASEAAVLLARISASDNREVSEAAARAWAETLPDVALADALAYLPEYYREASRDTSHWIYPGDVLKGVAAVHKRERGAVMVAARAAVLTAAEDEYEAGPIALRAAKDAGAKYDAEHTIPNGAPSATGSHMDVLSKRLPSGAMRFPA